MAYDKAERERKELNKKLIKRTFKSVMKEKRDMFREKMSSLFQRGDKE